MNFVELFTSFKGRISRKYFWAGVLGLLVVSSATGLAWGLITDTYDDSRSQLFFILLELVLLYPTSAILAKRLHDRNRPTWWIAFAIVPTLFGIFLQGVGLVDPRLTVVAVNYLISGLTVAVSVWFLIELGFMRGTIGPNRYGPDPVGLPQKLNEVEPA
jgi:uncharacterized membrane protein YhaH (DUF805 family)